MRKDISLILVCILLLVLNGCLPNLIVRNLEVSWDQTNKKAKAEIANIGNKDAGNFLVYFNADENPVSQNHRPQASHNVPGLAEGASIVFESDFAPLAHPDNNNLGNVYKITVIADPKNMVKESNENDNSKDVQVGCATADSDVTEGTTGTIHPGQSFNETRAVSVTVLGGTDRIVESLTLKGLNAGATAQVGARIYDGTTQMLIASSDVTVSAGSNITVTIPVTATLVSGRSYRIGFYVQTNPLWQASGNLFLPDAFSNLYSPIPYTESTGIFQIQSAHAIGSDSFPSNPNVATPQMLIHTRCP
jgi:hypothetical protein